MKITVIKGSKAPVPVAVRIEELNTVLESVLTPALLPTTGGDAYNLAILASAARAVVKAYIEEKPQ